MYNARLHGLKVILCAAVTAITMGSFLRPSVLAQDLVVKAQEEKKFVLYHSTGIEDTQQIMELFRKRYPFLLVENHRLSSQKLFQRIVSEVRAGRNLADAYIISGAEAWLLKDMGLLAPYLSPERSRIRPS